VSDNPIASIIDGIIDREGGYVDHPNDPGGATKYGITERVARAHNYTGRMQDLPRDVAFSIYWKSYVSGPNLDGVAQHSIPVAAELIDSYVNMGAGNAKTLDGPIYWLQRWLNALNRQGKSYRDIGVDGRIGPATLGALGAFLKERGAPGEKALVAALNSSQAVRYLTLIESRGSNESFAFGWLLHRVATPAVPE
jgi:lysozyme family protein